MEPISEVDIECKAPLCGQEDCDCGHTIEKLKARLDCGKDTDCADDIETQDQCKKHYVIYVESRAEVSAHDLAEVQALARSALECAANDRSAAFRAREERNHYKALVERREEALEQIKTGRMDIGGKDEAMPRAVMMSVARAAIEEEEPR